MRHVSLDIETLGTRTGSVILSIGAVMFDPDPNNVGVAPVYPFETFITIESCQSYGLTIDPSTLGWWMTQPPEARRIFEHVREESEGVSLQTALAQFTKFLVGAGWDNWNGEPCGDLVIWGNGSDFDNALLQDAFARVGLKTPWKFYNNRDLRTLRAAVGLLTGEDAPKFKPLLPHDALSDADAQRATVQACLKTLTEHRKLP